MEEAANGESFVIAKAGKPMVKVTCLDEAEPKQKRQFGFLRGKIEIPENFDTLFEKEIEEMFYGEEE